METCISLSSQIFPTCQFPHVLRPSLCYYSFLPLSVFSFFFLWMNHLTMRGLCLQSLLFPSPSCSPGISFTHAFPCKQCAASVICLPPSPLLLRKRTCTGDMVTSKRFSSSIASLQLWCPKGTHSERHVRNGNMFSWADQCKWQKYEAFRCRGPFPEGLFTGTVVSYTGDFSPLLPAVLCYLMH